MLDTGISIKCQLEQILMSKTPILLHCPLPPEDKPFPCIPVPIPGHPPLT